MTTDLSARLACFKLSIMIACVSGHLRNDNNLHQPPSRQLWCYHRHHLHQVHDHWSTKWALTINIIYIESFLRIMIPKLMIFTRIIPCSPGWWSPIETEAKHISILSVDLNKYRSLGAAVSLLIVIISLFVMMIVMISVLVVMMIVTPPISYIWQQTQENNDFENKMVTF